MSPRRPLPANGPAPSSTSPHRSRAPTRRAASLLLAATTAALAASSPPRQVAACASSVDVVLTTSTHPDLPLRAFAAGRVGVFSPQWRAPFLALAYRAFTGVASGPDEQRSALDAFAWRLRVPPHLMRGEPAPAQPVDPSADPSLSYASDARAAASAERWLAMRARALGQRGPRVEPARTLNYARVLTCYAPAFDYAAQTLEARLRSAGPGAPLVRRFVAAQDAVFSQCHGGDGATMPSEAPADASPLERADRAYQLAAAHFYAEHYREAADRFALIAVDRASPHRPWGGYLAARALFREATRDDEHPDRALIARAREHLTTALADPTVAATHSALASYAVFLDGQLDPRAAVHSVGVALTRRDLGAQLGPSLQDYSLLLTRAPSALALTEPDADRLTAWISVLQAPDGAAAFARAAALHRSTREPVWLLAALVRSDALSDAASVDPLLRAAAQVPRTHPAWLSLQHERARGLLRRGDRAGAYAAATQALAALRGDEGRSSENALRVLAFESAPDLDGLARNLTALPAGSSEDAGPVLPPDASGACGYARCPTSPALHPTASHALTHRLPASVWLALAQHPAVPGELRAHLAQRGFVRVALLDDDAALRRFEAAVRAQAPSFAPAASRLVAARGDARRLLLLELLARAPSLGPALRPWESGVVEVGASAPSFDYSSLWCPDLDYQGSEESPAPPLALLDAAQRDELTREHAALRALGAGPTFLAGQLAMLALEGHRAPQLAELLHYAVRATRYGCRDRGNTEASRAAFRALHTYFPRSPWTRRTPYYF